MTPILNLFNKGKRIISGDVMGVKTIQGNGYTVERLTPETDPYGYVTTTNVNSTFFNNIKDYMIGYSQATLVPPNGSTYNSSLINGNIFVWIPEFYYNIILSESNASTKTYYYYVASESNGGLFLKHPGSGRYISKYFITAQSDAPKSSSGKSIYYHSLYNKTYNQTVKATDVINFANSNYNNWGHFYCLDIATYSAIILLSLIDRCSFRINQVNNQNTPNINKIQSSIPCTPYITGTMDSSANNGVTQWGTDGTHMTYRGIEDFFIGFTGTPIIGIVSKLTNGSRYIYVNTTNLLNYDTVTDNDNYVYAAPDQFTTASSYYKEILSFVHPNNEYRWLFLPDRMTYNSNNNTSDAYSFNSMEYDTIGSFDTRENDSSGLLCFTYPGVSKVFNFNLQTRANYFSLGTNNLFVRQIFIPNS